MLTSCNAKILIWKNQPHGWIHTHNAAIVVFQFFLHFFAYFFGNIFLEMTKKLQSRFETIEKFKSKRISTLCRRWIDSCMANLIRIFFFCYNIETYWTWEQNTQILLYHLNNRWKRKKLKGMEHYGLRVWRKSTQMYTNKWLNLVQTRKTSIRSVILHIEWEIFEEPWPVRQNFSSAVERNKPLHCKHCLCYYI